MKKIPFLMLGFGLLLSGCGRSVSFHDDEYRGAWSNAFSSVEIRSRGEVELNEAGTEIVRVAPGARLTLRERHLARVREIEVTANADGTPRYEYEVDGRQAPYDDEARNWFAERLAQLVRETPIGAAARARRILRDVGPDALLDEVEDLESSTAAQIYITELAESASMDAPILQRAADTASRKISSSSRLRQTLIMLAEKHPGDPGLSVDLMEAAQRISSSSETRKALVEIARRRPLDSQSALAMARAIRSISSSSEMRAALEELAASSPVDDEVFSAYLETASRISSSSEQRRAMIALIDRQVLSPSVQYEAAQAVRRIASSSEKARVLGRLAAVCSTEMSVINSYLEAVESISSSSSQGEALMALLQNRHLGDEALREVVRTAERINSRSVREQVLDEAAKQRGPSGGGR